MKNPHLRHRFQGLASGDITSESNGICAKTGWTRQQKKDMQMKMDRAAALFETAVHVDVKQVHFAVRGHELAAAIHDCMRVSDLSLVRSALVKAAQREPNARLPCEGAVALKQRAVKGLSCSAAFASACGNSTCGRA